MHAVHKRNIGNSFPTPCWSTAVGCRYVSMSEMSEKTESGSWFELYTAYIIQKRNVYEEEISIKTTSHVYMLIYTSSAVTSDFKPVWHNRQHAVVCPKLKRFNRVYINLIIFPIITIILIFMSLSRFIGSWGSFEVEIHACTGQSSVQIVSICALYMDTCAL